MTPESVPVVAVQHNDHEEDVEAAIAKEPITEASHTSTTIQTPVTTGPPIVIPPSTKAPKQTLQAVYAAGKYKAGLTLPILCVQSFMAGIYIAFAGHLYLVVGGGVLGSSLFPGGLIAVVLTSAELYTGDALIFVASVLGGQVAFRSLLRNWTVSWCCNFVGSLVWAYFLAYLSGALHDSHAVELAIQVAEKKALNELSHIFIKAIGANFMYVLIYVKTNWSVCFVSLVFNYSLLTGIFPSLPFFHRVCVAVWQGTCAEEVAGKVLALWFPTAAFVMMGFDHVVANMFFIPIGMMFGANVSVGRMFAALAMATLGNAVGGGIGVGMIYWYVFDSLASFGGLTSRIRQNMSGARTRAALAGQASFHQRHRNSHHSNNTPPLNNISHLNDNGLSHRFGGKQPITNHTATNNHQHNGSDSKRSLCRDPPKASTYDGSDQFVEVNV